MLTFYFILCPPPQFYNVKIQIKVETRDFLLLIFSVNLEKQHISNQVNKKLSFADSKLNFNFENLESKNGATYLVPQDYNRERQKNNQKTIYIYQLLVKNRF